MDVTETITPGCPWTIVVNGIRCRCLHPDTDPHVHYYRGPDGVIKEYESDPNEPPGPGW